MNITFKRSHMLVGLAIIEYVDRRFKIGPPDLVPELCRAIADREDPTTCIAKALTAKENSETREIVSYYATQIKAQPDEMVSFTIDRGEDKPEESPMPNYTPEQPPINKGDFL